MELLSHHIPTRNLRASEHSSLNYSVPFNKRRTFGDMGFRTMGPKLWNTLPIAIRESETLDILRKSLPVILEASSSYFKIY